VKDAEIEGSQSLCLALIHHSYNSRRGLGTV